MTISGAETVAVIAIALTIERLQQEQNHEKAQQFMRAVWMDWRTGQTQVADGLATFFDLYFSTHGNFNKIRTIIADAIPEEAREEAVQDARDIAERNVQLFAKYEAVGGMDIHAYNVAREVG